MAQIDQQLFIKSIQDLAADIRAGGGAAIQGKNQASQIQLGQQQEASRQAFQKQQLKTQIGAAAEAARKSQSFRSSERQESQTFGAGESKLDRDSREKIASSRKPDQISIQIDNENKEHDSDVQNNMVDSDILIVEENEAGEMIITGMKDTSESQGKFLRRSVIDLAGKSDEVFNNPEWRMNHNKSVDNQLKMLRKQGHSENSGVVGMTKLMKIPSNADRVGYIKRLKGFRDSIIKREIARRMKDEDFTKVVIGSSLGGVQTRRATAVEEIEQRTRVRDRIENEVIDQFGGVVDAEILPTRELLPATVNPKPTVRKAPDRKSK